MDYINDCSQSWGHDHRDNSRACPSMVRCAYIRFLSAETDGIGISPNKPCWNKVIHDVVMGNGNGEVW